MEYLLFLTPTRKKLVLYFMVTCFRHRNVFSNPAPVPVTNLFRLMGSFSTLSIGFFYEEREHPLRALLNINLSSDSDKAFLRSGNIMIFFKCQVLKYVRQLPSKSKYKNALNLKCRTVFRVTFTCTTFMTKILPRHLNKHFSVPNPLNHLNKIIVFVIFILLILEIFLVLLFHFRLELALIFRQNISQ